MLSGADTSMNLSIEVAVSLASDACVDLSGRLVDADDDFPNLPHLGIHGKPL